VQYPRRRYGAGTERAGGRCDDGRSRRVCSTGGRGDQRHRRGDRKRRARLAARAAHALLPPERATGRVDHADGAPREPQQARDQCSHGRHRRLHERRHGRGVHNTRTRCEADWTVGRRRDSRTDDADRRAAQRRLHRACTAQREAGRISRRRRHVGPARVVDDDASRRREQRGIRDHVARRACDRGGDRGSRSVAAEPGRYRREAGGRPQRTPVATRHRQHRQRVHARVGRRHRRRHQAQLSVHHRHLRLAHRHQVPRPVDANRRAGRTRGERQAHLRR